jgi:hypothetical protein
MKGRRIGGEELKNDGALAFGGLEHGEGPSASMDESGAAYHFGVDQTGAKTPEKEPCRWKRHTGERGQPDGVFHIDPAHSRGKGSGIEAYLSSLPLPSHRSA